VSVEEKAGEDQYHSIFIWLRLESRFDRKANEYIIGGVCRDIRKLFVG
jgi:hypothetical protein